MGTFRQLPELIGKFALRKSDNHILHFYGQILDPQSRCVSYDFWDITGLEISNMSVDINETYDLDFPESADEMGLIIFKDKDLIAYLKTQMMKKNSMK